MFPLVISDDELKDAIVDFVREEGRPVYVDEILDAMTETLGLCTEGSQELFLPQFRNSLFWAALHWIPAKALSELVHERRLITVPVSVKEYESRDAGLAGIDVGDWKDYGKRDSDKPTWYPVAFKAA